MSAHALPGFAGAGRGLGASAGRFSSLIHGDDRELSWLIVVLLFIYGIVSWSPVWNALGVRGLHWLVLVNGATIFMIVIRRRRLKRWFFVLAPATVALASVPAFYWIEPRLALYPAFLITSWLLLTISTRAEIEIFIDLASISVLLMLIGAFIGFVIAYSGAPSLLHFSNPDGRVNHLFYTTLTNTLFGNIIRPAGIYDEPGAFSFVVCMVAFMRHETGRGYRLTWTLLMLGLISLSLAHLAFIVVFFFAGRMEVGRLVWVGTGVAALVLVTVSSGVDDVVRERFLARLEVDEFGRLAGDNRTRQLINGFVLLQDDRKAFVVGVHPDCLFEASACRSRFQAFQQSPLGPLVSAGILIAWPYYLLLGFAVLSTVSGRSGFAFAAVALLFLQRPNVFGIGYSFLATVSIWLQVQQRRLY